MKLRIAGLIVSLFLLGACSTTGSPIKQFTKGEELAFYDFTAPATFEEGLFGDNSTRLQISEGVYNISISAGDSTLYYGQWGATLSDVIIDVEAHQTSADLNSTYGVMCRTRGTVGQNIKAEATAEPTDTSSSEIIASANTEATAEATAEATLEATAEATTEAGASNSIQDNTSNNGDGYLFMVQGNGRYAILRSQSRKITPLVNWASSSVINSGAAQNRIRAVCMGNYLAMYVNGQFVADVTDDTYSKGQVGLVAASAARSGLAVTFDNLSVSEAKAG